MSKKKCINSLITIATKNGRDYVTPEDVDEAFKSGIEANIVRLEVLQIIGKQTEFGIEDSSLCAFIAYKGKSV